MTEEAAGSSTLSPAEVDRVRQAVQVPPPSQQLGMRVEHLLIEQDGPLAAAIASELGLPAQLVLDLMRFGAVHHCPVPPQPSAGAAAAMTPERLARAAAMRQEALARWGRSSAHATPRRVLLDCGTTRGAFVRVHLHPKRFPAAYSVDWRQRVLWVGTHAVVVDKPPGVQVVSTVDNIQETVVARVGEALGLDAAAGTLFPPHRLDAGTSGVVVLGRSSAAAAWLSARLQRKEATTRKMYRCVSAARRPPPLGRVVHWASVNHRDVAGEPEHTRMQEGEAEGTVHCELEVLQVQEVALDSEAAAEAGRDTGWEATIRLLTGRTHQIRAQMAAVGCPLLGDLLYGPLALRWAAQRRQQHQQQQDALDGGAVTRQPQPASTGVAEGGAAVDAALWARPAQADPLRAIGLQAFQLAVLDEEGWLASDAATTGDRGGPADGAAAPDGAAAEGEGAAAAAAVGAAGAGGALADVEDVAAPSVRHMSDGWVVFTAGRPWWRRARGATATA